MSVVRQTNTERENREREIAQWRNVCSFPETEEILNNGSDHFRIYLVETGEGGREGRKKDSILV